MSLVACLVDREIYLLGIKAFTTSEQFERQLSPFRESVYWVALRQEIHCALIRQRPLSINLDVSFLRHLSDLSTEKSWTQYCICNLAKVLMYCFARTEKSNAEWHDLWGSVEDLYRTLPSEYQPFYHSAVTGEHTPTFPHVWLLSETAGKFRCIISSSNQLNLPQIVHSVQYLTFSKILLSSFNPTIPKIGLRSRPLARKNEESIAELLRYLCGIGLSNADFGPGLFLTCIGISLSGDKIKDSSERDCLLSILDQTQAKHGWQSALIRAELLESWKTDSEADIYSFDASKALVGNSGQ